MSIFGASAAATPSASPFGANPFGQSTPAASPPAASPFGATPTGASAAFGATASPFSAKPTFGSSTPAFSSSTPSFGTPAFGSSTPAFGSSTPAFGASTPAFGSSTPAFGASTPAFGSSTPAFGASTPAFGSAPSFSGGFASQFAQPSFGTPAQAFGTVTPNNAPAAAPPTISGVTKVRDLPAHVQNELLACETHLRQQRLKAAKLFGGRDAMDSRCSELRSLTETHAQRMQRSAERLQVLHKQIHALRGAIGAERRSLDYVAHARDSLARIAERVPSDYFARVLDDMERRAGAYRTEIDAIDDFLRAQGVRLGTPTRAGAWARSRSQDTAAWAHLSAPDDPAGGPLELNDVLQRQYRYFMRVASQIAYVHENVRVLTSRYLELQTIRYGDTTNPFELADMREKAEKERQRILAEQRAYHAAAANSAQQNTGPSPFIAQAQPSMFGAQSQSSLFGSSTPAFGASTPGFGASTPAFGASTSAFGASTPAFGSSTPSLFGASSGSAFGSTTPGSTFGSTGAFGENPSRRRKR